MFKKLIIGLLLTALFLTANSVTILAGNYYNQLERLNSNKSVLNQLEINENTTPSEIIESFLDIENQIKLNSIENKVEKNEQEIVKLLESLNEIQKDFGVEVLEIRSVLVEIKKLSKNQVFSEEFVILKNNKPVPII